MMPLGIFFLVPLLSVQALLQVSLDQGLALTPQYDNINFIASNFEPRIYVAFQSNFVRVFSSDLVIYQDLVVPEPVQYINFRRIGLSTLPLSNGSSFSTSAPTAYFVSKNYTKVRVLNYNTHQQEVQIETNQRIEESSMIYTFTSSTSKRTYTPLICNKSFKLYQNQVLKENWSYLSIFGGNITAYKSRLAVRGASIIEPDFANITHAYAMSMSNNTLYRLDITIKFRFNYTLGNYQLFQAFPNVTLLRNFTKSMTGLIVNLASTTEMIIQSSDYQETYVWNISTNAVNSTVNMPVNKVFSYFKLNGTYYTLMQSGLYHVNYDQPTNILAMVTQLSPLPLDTYGVNLNPQSGLLYKPGDPYVYKFGACFTGGKGVHLCPQINCTDPICSYCTISPKICSKCPENFTLNGNYKCTEAVESQEQGAQPVSFLKKVWEYLINIGKLLIASPCARRIISPVFYYFGVFDDIYFYQYHDRLYGETMKSFFNHINKVENEKWRIINYGNVIQNAGLKLKQVSTAKDYQKAYPIYNYNNANEFKLESESLWANCQNFFTVSLPLTLVIFLVMRCLFRLTFNFKISKIFRKFNFWGYFLLLLFQGNIQQFAFYLVFEWKNIFFFTLSEKVVKILMIYFGFIIILVSTVLFFLTFFFYKKINYYLMDNNKNIFHGQLLLIFQFGIKNFFLGVTHSLVRFVDYRLGLSVILTVEVIFLVIIVNGIRKRVFKSVFKVLVYVFLNISKISLLCTFYFDYQNINKATIEEVQFYAIMTCLGAYGLGFILESLYSLQQIVNIIIFVFGDNKVQSQKDIADNRGANEKQLQLKNQKQPVFLQRKKQRSPGIHIKNEQKAHKGQTLIAMIKASEEYKKNKKNKKSKRKVKQAHAQDNSLKINFFKGSKLINFPDPSI